MKRLSKPALIFFVLACLITSCSKGYEVRVINRYVEDMDSVLIGDKIIYENLLRQTTTDYKKIEKGTYSIKFITKSKERHGFSISIPKRKSGKRTIQIDGQGTISVLQD